MQTPIDATPSHDLRSRIHFIGTDARNICDVTLNLYLDETVDPCVDTTVNSYLDVNDISSIHSEVDSNMIIPDTIQKEQKHSSIISDVSRFSSLLLPQVSLNFEDTLPGEQIDTRVTNNNQICSENIEYRLFRGPKDPLSNFYHHPLRWKNVNYISAEQAYQHEKFKYHKMSRLAQNELLKCKSSHNAKQLANRWLPVRCESWKNVRFVIMEDICMQKLKQCKAFKNALKKSGKAILVHNTETNSTWGCGPDFRGNNMMGKILMDVRKFDNQYEQEYPPLQETNQSETKKISHTKTDATQQKPNTLVIGNSNTRDMSLKIRERGLNSIGFVYPGQTIEQISNKVEDISKAVENDPPQAILIHAGDIEIREEIIPQQIGKNMKKTISKLHSKFPHAKVVISSIPSVPQRMRQMNQRIDEVNKQFELICRSNPKCVIICNRKAKLQRDLIHLTTFSKDFVARTFTQHIKQCL